MRIVMFYHSLVSDWNHGNAHFLRGVASELIERGHNLRIYEPRDAWSVQNLLADHGEPALACFHEVYPKLRSTRYDLHALDLAEALDGADLVLVHEWNERELVQRIGAYRARARDFRLLFHDTHHRALTMRDSIAEYDLRDYDGVLAFGEVLRELYLREGWTQRAWTWHEAADVRVFYPYPHNGYDGDLVWIGNWGDGERSAELHEYLLEPVQALRLKARAYGVRYPATALRALADSGIDYAGWLPNFEVPQVFARFKFTVHVPRRPYVEMLRGIPTIRVFEALACGIPLICAPWMDAEQLFTPGKDYLLARNRFEMQQQMRALLSEQGPADKLSEHGLQTIRARHTCAHRVDELLNIYAELAAASQPAPLTVLA